MKKILFSLIAIAIVIGSCSKAVKLNKRLDGTWSVTKIDGKPLDSTTVITFTFTKDKKGTGAYSETIKDISLSTSTITEKGTYTLENDERIFLVSDNLLVQKDTIIINSYSKTDMQMKETGNNPSTFDLVKK